ncbi:heavy-metal-associated domain-containing protein [Gordonia sp. CPCC 205333]|uniref:heavy-metal-associated domain-containing protein n=1 Tax=Gordonia sp. CPCC 205333 TaxID=3140790 RepID=UPI003AF37565
MNTAARLGLYGAGLLAIFGVSFAVAKPLVPDDAVSKWTASADTHGNHETTPAAAPDLMGLASASGGFVLSRVEAPGTVDVGGTLSFRIDDTSGAPLTKYTTAHGKQLHLIVVRTDGSGFRHVHPQLNSTTGIWSMPWSWSNAGTYRVFVDFTPSSGNDSVTLSRTVDVAGDLRPDPRITAATSSEVAGYSATLSGDLRAGSSSHLTVAISRNGVPVTSLQPYLGAFGHLVVLRQGDLAYLHVHPMGDMPTETGARSGPRIEFMATAPSVGRYLLYLDFQVDGIVHTATFVLDARRASAPAADADHGAH